MVNNSRTVKEEIEKGVRRELRAALADLKREVAELARGVGELEKRVRQVEKTAKTPQPSLISEKLLAKSPNRLAASRLRLNSKTVRALRDRLEITQAELATLLNVSAQAVYLWERRSQGNLTLRGKSQQLIAALNNMNKREVHELLAGAEA